MQKMRLYRREGLPGRMLLDGLGYLQPVCGVSFAMWAFIAGIVAGAVCQLILVAAFRTPGDQQRLLEARGTAGTHREKMRMDREITASFGELQGISDALHKLVEESKAEDRIILTPDQAKMTVEALDGLWDQARRAGRNG